MVARSDDVRILGLADDEESEHEGSRSRHQSADATLVALPLRASSASRLPCTHIDDRRRSCESCRARRSPGSYTAARVTFFWPIFFPSFLTLIGVSHLGALGSVPAPTYVPLPDGVRLTLL